MFLFMTLNEMCRYRVLSKSKSHGTRHQLWNLNVLILFATCLITLLTLTRQPIGALIFLPVRPNGCFKAAEAARLVRGEGRAGQN